VKTTGVNSFSRLGTEIPCVGESLRKLVFLRARICLKLEQFSMIDASVIAPDERRDLQLQKVQSFSEQMREKMLPAEI
jgi:hypothetical protein